MDTLKIANEALKKATLESLDVLEKVDAFYNNAWAKLLLFGSILFAIVGIFVPIALQWYQRRTMQMSETHVREKIKAELSAELLASIVEKFQANEKQIKALISSANSKILFSQAKFSLEKNSHKGALAELVTAGYSAIDCDDYRGLQDILDYMLKSCLPNLSGEEISDLKTAGVCDFTLFLDDLAKKDDRAMFQAKIGDIKVKLSKLPRTLAEKPDQKPKEA